jgi:hypothetical protein
MGIGIYIPHQNPESTMLFSCRYANYPSSSAAELAAIALALTILPPNSTTIIKTDNAGSIQAINKYTSPDRSPKTKKQLKHQLLLSIIHLLIKNKNLTITFSLIDSQDDYENHALADYAASLAHDSDLKISIKYQSLPEQRFIFHSKFTEKYPLDIPVKDYLDNYQAIKTNLELKLTETFQKTFNKHILQAMDHYATRKVCLFNSISDKETDSHQFAENTFRTKLFFNSLPTILDFHNKFPNLYQNATCKICHSAPETTAHIFFCNNKWVDLKKTLLNIFSSKLNPYKSISEINEFIQNTLEKCNFLKFDYSRSQTFNTEPSSQFSFVDLIRCMVPSRLKIILSRFLNLPVKFCNKLAIMILQQFSTEIRKVWLSRCSETIKWEKANNIDAAKKRNPPSATYYSNSGFYVDKPTVDFAFPSIFQKFLTCPSHLFSFFSSYSFISDINGGPAVETY